MTTKTNLTIKLEKEVRNEFNKLCDEIGISMAGALNALIKQAIRDKSMNFSLVNSNGFTKEQEDELVRRINRYNLDKSCLVQNELIEVD